MSLRYEDDEETRKASGFFDSTYGTIFDRLENEETQVRLLMAPASRTVATPQTSYRLV